MAKNKEIAAKEICLWLMGKRKNILEKEINILEKEINISDFNLVAHLRNNRVTTVSLLCHPCETIVSQL